LGDITILLILATIGFGFLWMMLAVVGAFQAGQHENFAFPMVVYYSPWFITGLWIFLWCKKFKIPAQLPPGPPTILDSIDEGNIEAVKQHLDTGTNVNVKDGVGTTPLHYAAKEGHKEIVELLINKGAHMNVKENLFGYTPLDSANGETADLLRKHGGKTGNELKAEGK
jgi:hypothetical protein